jgi:hypothetical protein
VRIFIEVCDDSLMPVVFRKNISEISVAFPILAALLIQGSVGKL